MRDSQGYFHREAAHADLCAVVPGLGEASESIFPEALADERLVYYPFVNNALGVVDALGAAAASTSACCWATCARCSSASARAAAATRTRCSTGCSTTTRWPCKANLRTRLHDMDELVGDIATQSVYVTIPNPLRA